MRSFAHVPRNHLPVDVVTIAVLETCPEILFNRDSRFGGHKQNGPEHRPALASILIYTETVIGTPAFNCHGFADFVAAFTALMFLTPSSASQSSSAFLPFVA